MRLTAQAAYLSAALEQARRIIPAHGQSAVDECVKLEAGGDALRALVFGDIMDGDFSVPATVEEGGEIVVPTRRLADCVKGMGGLVTVRTTDTSLILSAGPNKATIRRFEGTMYEAAPLTDGTAVMVTNGEQLRRALKTVIYVPPQVSPRKMLEAVHVSVVGTTMTLTACDGYRLARSSIVVTAEGDVDALIPGKAVRDILAAIGGSDSIELLFDANRVRVSDALNRWTVRLGAERFVDVSAMFPASHVGRARVSARELRATLDSASVFASGEFSPVTVRIADGALTVSSSSQEEGEATATTVANIEGVVDRTLGINSKFLVDVTRAAGEESVDIFLNDEKNCVLIKPVYQSGVPFPQDHIIGLIRQ
jgi:DNA polymerase-3 subunit beta